MLLAEVCLRRRRDAVAVIGAALVARAAGEGYRPIAARLNVPADTVRGWLRRFRRDQEAIRAYFSRWSLALDVELGAVWPAGDRFADAVSVIGVAARAFVLRFGPSGEAWAIAARLSGGALLCHTSCLFPAVP